MTGHAKYIILSNAIIFGNILANLIGMRITATLAEVMLPEYASSFLPSMETIGKTVGLSAQILIVSVMIVYELPIRRCLRGLLNEEEVEEEEMARARKRLLNEPFFIVVADLLIWFLAALIFAWILYLAPGLRHLAPSAILRNVATGLITVALVFFYLEHIIQHRIAPLFFPQGRLYAVPGAIRIKVGTRIAALILAGSFVPLFAIHLTVHGSQRALERGFAEPVQILEKLQSVILVETIIFIVTSIGLAFFVSLNITRPLGKITDVLRDVSRGIFDRKVTVTSNDEIGYAGDVINEMTDGLKDRERIKEAFGKYVSQEIRDEVLSGRIPLDGEMKDVSILFADLRDFTPMTEKNDPKVVVRIVNRYFKEMADTIQEHGGLVLQFLGDEIYAVFGAPVSKKEHPLMAFRAGLRMNELLEELNTSYRKEGLPTLKHGIGIHTGPALAATLGSPDRLSYLLIGDTVNLASRLQTLTKELGADIVLSADTYEHIPESEISGLDLTALAPRPIKGKTGNVSLFAIGLH